MSIQLLPERVVAQVTSSATVTSLNHVTCGLVANALDAHASKISISVDYSRGECAVEDDGLGIPPFEFTPDGGLAKPHHTSKHPSSAHFHGRNGTFIASVAALSLMSITSHHHAHHSRNSLKLHNSAVIARHTPCLDGSQLLRFSHGTRVSVRDLFGSMPVRVKQRASGAEKGIVSKDLDHLQRALVALLLAWSRPVNISLHESTTQQPIALRSPGSDPMHVGTVAYASRIYRLLNQTRLCNESDASWVPLQASAGHISLEGAVSLNPVPSKRAQFISIGVQPVTNEAGSNIIYEEANRIFANSSFGMEEHASEEKRLGHDPTPDYSNRELRARKGVDRWPMFYIQINLHGLGDLDPAAEPGHVLHNAPQALNLILDLTKAVLYEFLKKHQFRPTRFKHSKILKSSSSVKLASRRTQEPTLRQERWASASQISKRNSSSSQVRTTSPFDTWTRIKSGNPQTAALSKRPEIGSTGFTEPLVTRHASSSSSSSSLFGKEGRLLRMPFLDVEQEALGSPRSEASSLPPETDNSFIEWRNPITQELSLIDRRTGLIRQLPKLSEARESTNKRGLLAQARPAVGNERSQWLQDVLSSWENPVFQQTERPIPAVNDTGFPGFAVTSTQECRLVDACGLVVAPGSSVDTGKISKEALRRGQVISQVDKKFVLVRVASESGAATMLLVDQHAADERCRVESLLRDYFLEVPVAREGKERLIARSELLEKPLIFDTNPADAQQLDRTLHLFQHWGISYRVKRSGAKSSATVEVVKLPPSILERCRAEPRLVIELLRKEAWKQDVVERDGVDKGLHWLASFHGCPQGILDMINSRACRSAIMFNDGLTEEECASLVRQLADCALPFQCAHGRPSMVPLLGLGEAGEDAFSSSTKGYGRAFKQWTS